MWQPASTTPLPQHHTLIPTLALTRALTLTLYLAPSLKLTGTIDTDIDINSEIDIDFDINSSPSPSLNEGGVWMEAREGHRGVIGHWQTVIGNWTGTDIWLGTVEVFVKTFYFILLWIK
jgi:hypothetical protein